MSDTPPTSPLVDVHDHESQSRDKVKVAIEQAGTVEYTELAYLRRLGWKSDELDEYYSQQRAYADESSDEQNRFWFDTMKKAMQDIDRGTRCIPFRPMRFLDLGCAPGGFASYILAKNVRATGVGVSLPADSPGWYPCLIEEQLRTRFDLRITDILSWGVGYAPRLRSDDLVADPFAAYAKHFDLVVLDSHYSRPYNAAHPGAPWDWQRLRIAQLVVALQTVTKGGTIVMRLNHPEMSEVAMILHMLDGLSESLRLWKPHAHAPKGTFYAVAKGVGLGEQSEHLHYYVDGLKMVWDALYTGGEEGRGRFLVDDDMAFIATPEEIVEDYLDRLVYLARPIWRFQCIALKGWLKRRGIIPA